MRLSRFDLALSRSHTAHQKSLRAKGLGGFFRSLGAQHSGGFFCSQPTHPGLAPHDICRSGGCFNFVSPILACLAEGPSTDRMTWHHATLRRLEPDGPDRDYGAGVGPNQARYQPVRLTRTRKVLISLSTQPFTSPGDIGSGGADLGSVLIGHCSECDVTSIICRCSHYYTAPVRTLYKGRPCRKRALAVTQWQCSIHYMILIHALLLMMVLQIQK